MRVLLTGQRDEAGSSQHQPGATTRRLSGRVSRESSPQLVPLSEDNLLSAPISPASKHHHKHSFSLTSPLALPRVSSQDVNVTVPLLQRTTTTDRMDLTPSTAVAAAMAAAPSSTHTLSSTHNLLHDPNMTHSMVDLFDVPQPASPSTLLTADEYDSDDEGDTSVDTVAPSASSEVSVPTQHGLFFHRLLAHLPFTLPPSFIRHIETAYAILITLSLFYTLFVDPIRLALLPPSFDLPLTVLLFLIFLLLLLELLFFLVSNPSYSHSLECMLDALACLSLLPQLYCMWTDRELTRFERAVMMMCRAGVMVRLVGVLRLLGAWDIWERKGWESLMRGKWWWQHMRRKWRQRWKHRSDKSRHTDSSINLLRAERDHANDSSDDEDSLPPADNEHVIHDGLTSVLYPSHASRIGQLLSDYTAHRVVLGVLFTLILYNYVHPQSVHTVHPYAIAHLDSLLDGHIANITASSIEHSIQQYIDSYRPELLSLRMDGVVLYEQNATFAQLRRHEIERIVTPHFDVWINIKPWSQQFALFDFWSLLMVLLLLPVLLCLIYADVHAVITPIERMCKFVTNLATDPMSEIGGADPTLSSSLQSLLPTATNSSLLGSSASSSSANASNLGPSFSLDSFLVELTLQKLAILLQLVFGSAGANIIANNIRGDYLEVITPGRKVYAIFSFLTVEGWDEVMEVLEVEMSELMNCVAELVHSVCVLFGGEVNKNIGNAFLLVWKLEAEAKKAVKDGAEDDEGWMGGDRGRLPDGEKGRRQTHHHDERGSGSIMQSSSIPHALNTFLPHVLPSPARATSITDSPPSPRPPARSYSQSLSIPHPNHQSPALRQRKSRPPPLPHSADSSHYPHEPMSPVEYDSPPSLVHRNRSEIPTEIVDDRGLKRRNSLLFGMLSLNPKDLSKIFTRSTMNIFGVMDEANRREDDRGKEEAEEAEHESKGDGGTPLLAAMKEEKDFQRTDILSELPGKASAEHHLGLSAADISPASATTGGTYSPASASFYARTRPAPPMRRSHTWKDSASNHRVAEHALSSFLLTLLQLSTSPALHKWRTHPQLASHHLSLQFAIGLHAGWAIEGAIGSSHKIDASYLSPNVNLSSRLSMLCHHYRLPLLFSSSFYALLGMEVQKRCRRVDVVSVKGSRKPVGIYTFDVDFGEVDEMERARVEEWLKEGGPASGCAVGSSSAVGGSGSKPPPGVHESYDERMRRRQVKEIDDIMRQLNRITKRKATRAAAPPSPGPTQSSDEDDEGHTRSRAGRRASAPSVPAAALSRSSSSSNLSSRSPLLPSLPELLTALQSHLPPAFIPLYNAACSCYLDGDWRSAGRLLVRVLTLRSGDGPSQLLLKVMAKEGFRAPTGWKGYRVLTKK